MKPHLLTVKSILDEQEPATKVSMRAYRSMTADVLNAKRVELEERIAVINFCLLDKEVEQVYSAKTFVIDNEHELTRDNDIASVTSPTAASIFH
jgi:hypothetical protein